MQPSVMVPTVVTPIRDCVEFVREFRGSEQGCICPVCGTYNKVKRYKLMRQHFEILSTLAAADEPVHCREFAGDGQAYNKMLNVPKHYGFISQPGTDATRPFNRSGLWAITDLGRQFMANLIRVPAYFWGIHDAVVWWSPSLMSHTDMESGLRYQSHKTLVEEMLNTPMDQNRGVWAVQSNL